MNIGTVPTMYSVNNNQKIGQSVRNSEDFKGVFFASLVQSQSGSKQLNGEEANGNIAEVLKNILKLLTKDFSSDLNTLKLMDTSKMTEEQISEFLGMTAKDWKEQLSKLSEELFTLLGNNPQIVQQLFDVKKSINEERYLQGTNQLMAIIVKLPKETIQKLKPEQFQFMAKTAKAVENFGKMMDLSKEDIKNLSELKESIQNLVSKVEQLVKNNSSQARNVILKNTFHSILADQKDSTIVQSTAMAADAEAVDQNVNMQNNLQHVSKIEQFVLHVGKENKPVNYEQFVKDFSNILAKSQFTQVGGANKLLIKLYPEHLGSLRIEILQDNGVLTAKMFATTGAAKEILDSQMNQLKNAFSQQNVTVEKIDVIYGQTETQKFDRGGHQQQQAYRQQQEFHEQDTDEEENVQFSDVLSQSLIEEKI